jgi:hypothetical protein
MFKQEGIFFDESGDRKYFTVAPNIVVDKLKGVELSLYLQIKRVAGEHGSCWLSRKELCRKIGASHNTLKKAIKSLIDGKWIILLGRRVTCRNDRAPWEYAVTDIWKANVDFYNRGSENDPRGDKQELSTGKKKEVHGGQNKHRRGSNGAKHGGQNKPQKKNNLKEDLFKKTVSFEKIPKQIPEEAREAIEKFKRRS